MIKMICGVCRTADGLKRPSDPPFSMSPDEEKRLVESKVAIYATGEGVATPPAGLGDNGGGTTPPEQKAPSAPSCISADDLPDSAKVLDIVDGHFAEDGLSAMKNAELKALAIDLGLDPKGCGNKAEYVALLLTVEITEDDDSGDAPPITSGGDIVQ